MTAFYLTGSRGPGYRSSHFPFAFFCYTMNAHAVAQTIEVEVDEAQALARVGRQAPQESAA
jgi:hypothetical protein